VYKYTRIKGLDYREITSLAKSENVIEYGESLIQSLPEKKKNKQNKKNMLITRPFAYSDSLQHPTS